MTTDELLGLVKMNLQIAGSGFDDYLSTLIIPAAEAAIREEGITLDLSEIGDCNLVVMYAAYLYRKRAESTVNGNLSWAAGMPRMLRYALNNRLFSEKMKAEESGSEGGA